MPRRAQSVKEVSEKQRANFVPCERRPPGPCVLLICTTKGGDLRPGGRETVNPAGGGLPGRVQMGSQGLLRCHISLARTKSTGSSSGAN